MSQKLNNLLLLQVLWNDKFAAQNIIDKWILYDLNDVLKRICKQSPVKTAFNKSIRKTANNVGLVLNLW